MVFLGLITVLAIHVFDVWEPQISCLSILDFFDLWRHNLADRGPGQGKLQQQADYYETDE